MIALEGGGRHAMHVLSQVSGWPVSVRIKRAPEQPPLDYIALAPSPSDLSGCRLRRPPCCIISICWARGKLRGPRMRRMPSFEIVVTFVSGLVTGLAKIFAGNVPCLMLSQPLLCK